MTPLNLLQSSAHLLQKQVLSMFKDLVQARQQVENAAEMEKCSKKAKRAKKKESRRSLQHLNRDSQANDDMMLVRTVIGLGQASQQLWYYN